MEFKEFVYTEQGIRTVEIEGEPWFVVKDVCDVFGVTNNRNIIARLSEDEKTVINVHDVDGIQKNRKGNPNITIMNESGLYRTIFSLTPTNVRGKKRVEVEERLQKVENFRKWVYREVLPSIRKTGQYIDINNKFTETCPISFDRSDCISYINKLVKAKGMPLKESQEVWCECYIGFSGEVGYNIHKKATALGMTKIAYLEREGLTTLFVEYVKSMLESR